MIFSRNFVVLFFIFTFLFLTFNIITATDFWTKQQREQFVQQKSFLNITKISQSDFFGFKKPTEKLEGYYPYPAEMTEIAQFLSQWQVLDPTSPNYGGMIEAESGQLGNVIQTDNTQEAIVVWCQYANFTGDSTTYRSNINAAWDYIMNFPAYNEEGDPGDEYYRNHNCAWSLWGEQWYRWIYNDTTYKWYADSCARYMMEHPMLLETPGSSLNAFVTGWMAGNLYWYGNQNMNQVYMDSAVSQAGNLKNWVEVGPQNRLTDFEWAMSSGTIVWGLYNSIFKDDSLAGINWLQTYGQYLPLYYDNADPGAYVWDSSWNVALANAYRAVHLHTQENNYNQFHKVLTDTLLSLDVDDDGGIMSNKLHPPFEDMSWVTAYLSVMGVDYRIGRSPDIDAGIVQFYLPNPDSTYITGDTLDAAIQIANFGQQALQSVQLNLMWDGIVVRDTTVDLNFGEKKRIEFAQAIIVDTSGLHQIIAEVQTAGDLVPGNNQQQIEIDVPPFLYISGVLSEITTSNPVGGMLYFNHPVRLFTIQVNPFDGTFSGNLIEGNYELYADVDYPFAQFRDSLMVDSLTVQNPLYFDVQRAELVLIDDDEGADYERWYQTAIDEIKVIIPTESEIFYHYWDQHKEGIFPAKRINEIQTPAIIWYTGNADTTALMVNEQDSLSYLLSVGTNVLLTGKNIAESLQGSPFLANVLQTNYVGNSEIGVSWVYGVVGDIVSDGLSFNTVGGEGANNQGYDRDILQPLSGATPIFYYWPNDSLCAGVRISQPNYKLVFLGFGAEGIRDNYQNYDNRSILLVSVLRWFGLLTEIEDNVSNVMYPNSFRLLGTYPNPFNSSISIEFYLPERSNVVAEIFDLLGQRVKVLTNRNYLSGEHLLQWNGKNGSGTTVSSGIYYLKISTTESVATTKMVFVK